jgi:predicted amidohydrolase
MKVTLSQIAPKLNKENMALHIDIINANIGKSDLIIFPELSLNGYLLMDAVYDNCYMIDELEIFKNLSKSIDIIIGVVLKIGDKIYNSSVYFSNKEVVSIHNKNHLPNYGMFEESRYFFASNHINVFDTKFGKSAMIICEDLWNSKTMDFLANLSLDNVFVTAASPSRNFSNKGLLIKEQWYSILKTTALYSGANVIFVNRVGFEDGLGFWGGSCIVTPSSEILESLELFDESIETIEIDESLSKNAKYMLRHR